MAISTRWALLSLLLAGLFSRCEVSAQTISDLPRAEYYVAKELYGAGRTAEAMNGFDAALGLARQIGNERWVDSIPPLVMRGECYYQQGNLALALQQYNLALTLALANPSWIDQIEVGVEQLPLLESSKSPNWFTKSQGTISVAVPEGVQIAIDPTQAQIAPGGGVVAPVTLITRLDATEILKTMGIALLRRAQILGPLAPLSPLSGPLQELYARKPLQQAAWVIASWSVLHGISSLSSERGVDVANELRNGMVINGKFDYFMSPLALLVLGQREARAGTYQAAIIYLQDAALIAGQFDQHVLLAECLRSLTACATASGRADLIDPIQNAAAWSAKKSPLSQLTAVLGVAELCVASGNLAQADKLLKQASVGLRAREIMLPRHQAHAAYVSALMGFAQKRGAVGLTNLNAALKLMHGSAATGPVVERVFQAQQTLDLLAAGQLTAQDADRMLSEVLAEPDSSAWRNAPLETIAAITTASVPAFERHLQLSAARGDTAEVLLRMDRLQRQRLYEALPLGGRLLSWRSATTADPQTLPADVRQAVQDSLQRSPQLRSIPQQIDSLVEALSQGPLPLDERQLTPDAKKTFAQLEDLSASYENLLAFQSLSRTAMVRYQPEPAIIERLQQRLAPGDVAIALATTGQQIFGAAISRDEVTVWQVPEVEGVRTSLNSLLIEIGLWRQPAGQLPSAATRGNAAWRKTAADLHTLLFPAPAQRLIANARRLIMAPNDQLWYVPYELLPEGGVPDAQPWLARRSITYVPTLGSLALAYSVQPQIKETVGIVGTFFALDKVKNLEQADGLVNGIPQSSKIMLTQKITVPSALWLRLRAEQLWVANEIENVGTGWDTILVPVGKPQHLELGSWLQMPRVAPDCLLLPGFKTSMATGNLQNGNDVFLPACGILFGGSRSAVLSRWPAGGKSSQRILLRCLEELPDEPASAALRRSVLALWAEDFLTADEPALLPAGKEAAALTSGQHPLLWSGYMSIGDTVH